MNPNLDITYQQHLDFLRRVYLTAQAELDGFVHAHTFDFPMKTYSNHDRMQATYEQGFRDGKAKLLQAERVTAS